MTQTKDDKHPWTWEVYSWNRRQFVQTPSIRAPNSALCLQQHTSWSPSGCCFIVMFSGPEKGDSIRFLDMSRALPMVECPAHVWIKLLAEDPRWGEKVMCGYLCMERGTLTNHFQRKCPREFCDIVTGSLFYWVATEWEPQPDDEVKPRTSRVEVERGRMGADGGGHEGESRD